MKLRRTPFYGDDIDRALLGPDFRPGMALVGGMGDGSEPEPLGDLKEPVRPAAGAENDSLIAEHPSQTVSHPDYRELGTEVALGFMPHQGENRKQRLAGVATWNPKDHGGGQQSGAEPRPAAGAPPPPMPTRRELWKQRQRQRRGKLDPELRRLQREKAKTK